MPTDVRVPIHTYIYIYLPSEHGERFPRIKESEKKKINDVYRPRWRKSSTGTTCVLDYGIADLKKKKKKK